MSRSRIRSLERQAADALTVPKKRIQWDGPDGCRKRNGAQRMESLKRANAFAARFWSGRMLDGTPWAAVATDRLPNESVAGVPL